MICVSPLLLVVCATRRPCSLTHRRHIVHGCILSHVARDFVRVKDPFACMRRCRHQHAYGAMRWATLIAVGCLATPAAAPNRLRQRRVRRQLTGICTIDSDCNGGSCVCPTSGRRLLEEEVQGRRLFGAPSRSSCSCTAAPPPPPPPSCYGFLTPLGDMTYPAGTTTLNTNDSPYGFNFTTLTIPAGATVTAIGESPLRIYVSGAADVAGILSVNGGNGDNGIDYQIGAGGGAGGGALLLVANSLTVSGTISANGGNGGSVQTTNGVLNPNNGGVGVAGGSNGGNGGLQNVGGYAGYGAGGGHGGRQESGWPGGGTGGGYGQNGAPCSGGACDHPTVGGLAYGDETMSTGLLGGSGGGGGGNDGDNEEGPGGGGSGGGIWIRAGSLVLSGTVSALGGSIGTTTGAPQAGAGGVGRIRIDYNSKSGSVPTTQYYDGQTTSCVANIV